MFSAGAGIAVVCVGVLSAATFLPDPITFSNEPELTVIPVITDPSDIALPVDQFLPSAEEIRTMQHGTYEAVATCMKEFGLDFEVQPEWYSKVSMFPVEGSEFSYAGLYGLLDSEQAERKGYHAGPNTAASAEDARREAEREAQRWQTLPDAYLNVLGAESGGGSYANRMIPQGGCLQEGKRQIQGSKIDLLVSYEEIMAQSWAEASGDSRVQSVFAAWSDCMLRAGYSYQSPWDANDDRRWGTITVSQLGIETAVADVSCKKRTNLVGVYSAVQGAYQYQLINERSQELDAEVEAFDHVVEKAKSLLSVSD